MLLSFFSLLQASFHSFFFFGSLQCFFWRVVSSSAVAERVRLIAVCSRLNTPSPSCHMALFRQAVFRQALFRQALFRQTVYTCSLTARRDDGGKGHNGRPRDRRRGETWVASWTETSRTQLALIKHGRRQNGKKGSDTSAKLCRHNNSNVIVVISVKKF